MNETTETATGAALKRSAGDAKSEVKNLASDAKQQARGMIDEKKGVLADSLSGVARAIRNASGELQAGEGAGIAPYVDEIAGSIDRVAQNIKERDLQGVAQDVQSFARRQPALFIGGCVALGFALSRFLKASEKKQAIDVDLSSDVGDVGVGGVETSSWAAGDELGVQSLSHENWDEPLVPNDEGVTR